MTARRLQSLAFPAAAAAVFAGSSLITTTLAFAPPTSIICRHPYYAVRSKRKQVGGGTITTTLEGMANADDDNDETNDNNNNTNNFLTSLTKLFTQTNNDDKNIDSSIEAVIETEEDKQKRLRLERLTEIELGEQRRQARVDEDKFVYLFLFALQLLPLLGTDRIESIAYFFGVAVTTVYLGGRQEVIDKPEQVTKENALYAPIGASLAIGGLYTLLKVGIDITSLYAIMVTIFGALAISGKIPLLILLYLFPSGESGINTHMYLILFYTALFLDIGVPLLRNTFPGIDFSNADVPVPKVLAEKLNLDKPSLPLDGLITLGLGVLCTLIYWAPAAMEQKFLISNGKLQLMK